MSDGLLQVLSDDGPWVILVFFLIWRDFEKDKATRLVIEKSTAMLVELTTIIRERLPGG
ncbi:MAG: hypothetical protein AAFR34_11945 [Pseudomonadota bacterium]